MSTPEVGLQVYTIRDETTRDAEAAYAAVAAMGYRVVEIGGFDAMEPGRMKRIVDENGFKVAGIHTSLPTLEDPERRQNEIEHARQFGARYIIVAFLQPEDRTDPRLTERMNAVGRVIRDAGLTLVYHNHAFEFEPDASGNRLMDRLLTETDPDLVKLEFDVYWAAFAGVDPLEFLRQYGERIPLVHLKDLAPDRQFADVGEGTLDMHEIIRLSNNADFLLVENDRPSGSSLQSARRSLENLRGMGIGAA